jgi:tetratricopeptide (TPR) repeat protein
LTGAPRTLATRVSTVSDATLSGATRLVHGYFDGPSSFHIAIEDAATHKMVATRDLTFPPLAAMNQLAHLINPDALPFSGTKDESISAWGARNFEQAVAEDPGFGAAWLGWVQQLVAQRENQKALEVANRALAAPLRSEIERAQIETLAAGLRDDAPRRMDGVAKLASLIPLDAQLWRTLAQERMNARQFPEAAEAYRKTIQIEPADANSYNLLGYAQGFAGDLEGAKKTFADYAKMANQAANSFDSLGDVYFANGKFAEADQSYMSAQQKDPNLLGGGDLMKAAYARWFAGNHDAADQAVRDFLIARVKQHDPLTNWREATWLYSTGREAQAKSSLEKGLLEDAPPEAKDLMKKQLVLWSSPNALPKDARILKNLYEHTPPAQDGLLRTIYAGVLVAGGKKDEAQALVKRWPIPESGGDPLFQSFLYPKFLEVRKQLGQ